MSKKDLFSMDKTQLIMNKYSQIASNLCLGSFFTFFLVMNGRAYISTSRPSLLFYIILNSIFLVFAIIRKPAKDVDVNFLPWLFALGGTLLPLLLFPDGNEDLYLGMLIQIYGIVMAIASGMSLNRALGMVAANRGIKTNGIYRLVRHPLYFSYAISMIGFIVNNFNAYNVFVLIIHIGFQIQRIKYEERLLSKDGKYKTYMSSVKYRMFPYVY